MANEATPPEQATKVEKPAAPPKPTNPTQMLEIITFASLDVVGTENYLRYGPTGPLRYVKSIPEGHNSPQNLHATLEIKSAWENAAAVTHQITFWRTHHAQGEKAVWASNDRALHTQMMWVWDFYRMLSYFQMRVELPIEPNQATGEWAILINELHEIKEEGSLILRVNPKSGEIIQRHNLTSPKQMTIADTEPNLLTQKP
ncbi:MAG: hypothetical protein HY862_06280 [Chloroflexi bacterium]|nr:hypothetical protein [Chloroflexota bacterium]